MSYKELTWQEELKETIDSGGILHLRSEQIRDKIDTDKFQMLVINGS